MIRKKHVSTPADFNKGLVSLQPLARIIQYFIQENPIFYSDLYFPIVLYSILYKWFYILHTFCTLHPCCICSYSCRSSKFLYALLSAQCHFFPLLCTSFSVCCLLSYHCSPFHKFPTFSTSIFSVITLVFFHLSSIYFFPFLSYPIFFSDLLCLLTLTYSC